MILGLDGIKFNQRSEINGLAMRKVKGLLLLLNITDEPIYVRYIPSAKPVYEVQMKSATHSQNVRQTFSRMFKSKSLPAEIASLSLTNCVTLGTRVRISILRVGDLHFFLVVFYFFFEFCFFLFLYLLVSGL